MSNTQLSTVVNNDMELYTDQGPAPAPHKAAPNPLQQIHRILKGRYLLAIGLALGCGAGGAILGWKQGKITYQSVGVVRLMPVLPRVLYGDEEKGGVMPMYEQFVETQATLLQSERVLDMALQDPNWRSVAPPPSPSATDEFKQQLAVVRRGELLTVIYIDENVERVRPAVEAVLDAYDKLFGEAEIESGKGRMDLLLSMKTNLIGELNLKDQTLLQISNRSGTGDLDSAFKKKSEELDQIESKLTAIDFQLTLLAGNTTRPAGPLTQDELALSDPTLQKMLQDRKEQQRRVNALLVKQGPKADLVRQAQEELAAMDQDIADFVHSRATASAAISTGGTPGSAEIPLAMYNAKQLQELRPKLIELRDKARKELAPIWEQKQKYEQAKGEELALKQQIEQVSGRINQLEVESKVSGRIEMISKGDRPSIAKDTRKILAAAGAGGLGIFGFGIVAVLGLADHRMRDANDVSSAGRDAPMLGILPELPDDLADPEQAALTAHFVHQIRALLQIHNGPSGHRLFAVTSPMSGSGKTSLTLALGVSFAEAGSRTLLIDCDMVGAGLTARASAIVRRKIGRIFRNAGLVSDAQLDVALKFARDTNRRLGEILVEQGFLKEEDVAQALRLQQQKAMGLFDALKGEDLDECVAATGIPNLFVLPVGKATAAHASRLSPSALHRVLELCREKYDTILVDTGPVPGSLEASIVATEVDGVILTVARGENRTMMAQSAHHLESIGARIAGVVFNRANANEMSVYSTTMRSTALTSRRMTSVDARGTMNGEHSQDKFGPMARAVAASNEDDDMSAQE